MQNLIDKDGKILSPNQWFCDIRYFINGHACVQREDYKWNFLDENGNIISKIWFNNVYLTNGRYYVGKFQNNIYFCVKNKQISRHLLW